MVTTTYDISEITESLVTALTNAVTASPLWTTIKKFTIAVSSSSPETVRGANLKNPADCQLTLYLLHVGQNPFMRNTPIFGPNALLNTQQPLSLDLSYLLTAFAADNADQEQQAMSIALRALHEQAISNASGQELTITIGTDKLDEMSRLWQSFAVAYRLSAVIRVAVALITPSQPPTKPFPPPKQVDIAVAPAAASLAVTPQLFAPSRTVAFSYPSGSTDPTLVTTTPAPLVATAGATLRVAGAALQGTAAFLSTLDASQTWPLAGWRIDPGLDSELVLSLPTTYAIAPAAPAPASLPPPGVYLLTVVNTANNARSPAIPLVIAPQFANVASPPLLPAVGQIYTIHGAGFVPTATQMWLGGTPLQLIATAPAPATGSFAVSGDGTSLSFSLPANQPSGLTSVRVRVDGVDAPPSWQVLAP